MAAEVANALVACEVAAFAEAVWRDTARLRIDAIERDIAGREACSERDNVRVETDGRDVK